MRSFLRGLNSKKIPQFGPSRDNDLAVTLTLCLTEKLQSKHNVFKELIETFASGQLTHYIGLLGTAMSLQGTLDTNWIHLTIRTQNPKDFDYALQLKKDLMRYMTEHSMSRNTQLIKRVKMALTKIDCDSNDKDLAVQRCYQFMRGANQNCN